MKKRWMIFIALVIILMIFIGDYFLNISGLWKQEPTTCGDETLFGACSLNKPYFCENGILVEKASECSCPEILIQEEESCISQYQTTPKDIILNYILRGEEKQIDFIVYEGMANYLSNLPVSIHYAEGEQPSRVDFKLQNINEEEQKELLLPLVIDIQNLDNSKIEQMRIAVSLVQNIPYSASDKTITLLGNIETNYSRYPYEVLYDEAGICGEKTELLLFLLKEIGYEVAFFHHAFENHESVGIKCPEKYSMAETGYCFVETTAPVIISDDKIEYVNGLTLGSVPEVYPISEGISLPKRIYEYGDADNLEKLRQGKFTFAKIENLKEKYGLIEEYYVG